MYRRPSIAVLSTGDELVEADTKNLKWGQVGSLLQLPVRNIPKEGKAVLCLIQKMH